MRLRIGLFLLPVILIEGGCGLPDSYFLYPPSVERTMDTSTPVCVIAGTSRTSDINVNFKGYELYYKLYSTSPTDGGYYASSSYTVDNLTAAGFSRVCRGPGSVLTLAVDSSPGAASAPLIDIAEIDADSIGNNFTVTIIFDDSSPPAFGFSTTGNPAAPLSYCMYSPPSTSTATQGMEIRRYVQADASLGSVCKTFASDAYYASSFVNYLAGDADGVTSAMRTAAQNNGGNIYIMLYVVSYGKADDGTNLRSSPAYLGYTEKQIIYQ